MLYLFIYYCLRGEIKMQRKGRYETICDCFGLIIYCDVYTWFLLRKNLSGVKKNVMRRKMKYDIVITLWVRYNGGIEYNCIRISSGCK
jgi:hypothetical protein